MARNRFRNQEGSAVVELALVAPLLMGMMICTAELGRIAYAAIEVQNAARAGAAYGAQNNGTAADSTDIEKAAAYEAPNLTLTWGTAPTQTCVCETITFSTTAGGNPSTSYSSPAVSCSNSAITGCNTLNSTESQQPVVYVTVVTTATVHTMFTYNYKHFGLPSTYILNGYSQMRVIQ